MRCPYCGSPDDKVVDSRTSRDGRAIRRRRECLACQKRFTTYEYIEDQPLVFIKSDGRREPFDRVKVFNSIRIACNKRPISVAQIEEAVDEIESKLEGLGEREVMTKQIGELVMEYLRRTDEVAYVRFASVYRQFQDKSEFLKELQRLGTP
jgi:transcriptional repressor NrdR